MNTFLHHKGYTLIEILIAFSIMALTLAFAGPKFEEYTKSQQVKNTARQIYANLQTARLTAVKENVNVTAAINSDSPSMTVTRSSDGSDVIPAVNFLQDSPNIIINSNGPEAIDFNPIGTIGPVQNQTIEISYPDVDTKYSVIIWINGRVRFQKDA